jgi:hypothetical protein
VSGVAGGLTVKREVGIEATGSPPRFAVFSSREYCIRALAALLAAYQDRHGLRTVC